MFKYLVPAALLASPSALIAQDTPAPEVAAQAEEPAAQTRPPEIPTAAFAGRSQLRDAKLSPSGHQIALAMDLKGVPNIVLFDAATKEPLRKFGIPDETDLEWFRWISDTKLLISISKMDRFIDAEMRFTRLYMANFTDNQLRYIGDSKTIVDGDDVIHVADDASSLLLSVQRTPYEYPSVMRFDLTVDDRPERVQAPRQGVWNWYADNAGIVRVGTGWRGDRMRVFYRAADGDKLRLIDKVKEENLRTQFWDVAQIISGTDEGYVLSEDRAGKAALRRFDYATQKTVETFYAHPDWGLDSVTLDEQGKPVAAYYVDDRDRVVWFTEGMQRVQALLDKSIREEEVWITSRSKNNERMLVWAGGPADPGVLYIFTPQERSLKQFFMVRPEVDFQQLSKPEAVNYTARDGTEIRAYLTLPRGRESKNLPLILIPHGGPYGVRDKLTYNDEVQLLANRGYAVLQPNYRGSDGYGKAFAELGRGQIGRKMQDDLDDAVAWAVEQGTVDKDRVCIVGGSYGGYAALWGAIRNPEVYRCAASWAGVTDFDSQLKYDRNFFSRAGGKKWRNRVRGSDEDFDLDSVSPSRQVEQLTRPVLLAHGTDDTNVPFSQYRKMRNATKKADKKIETLVIEDEGHSFSKPENEKLWYDTLLSFLDKHNPAD